MPEDPLGKIAHYLKVVVLKISPAIENSRGIFNEASPINGGLLSTALGYKLF